MPARCATRCRSTPAQNDSRRGWDTRNFGVEPRLIADLLALVGDAADGYPGIAGIGPRTAAELLNRYDQIEIFLHTFSANSAISHCFSKTRNPAHQCAAL